MKVLLKIVALCTLLLSSFVVPTTANANDNTVAKFKHFTDVKKDHYAYDAILWAQRNRIINGYSDGRFAPNDTVTEAQFAKMLTNYFELKDSYGNITKTTVATHWADGYYDALAQYAVPLNGYFDNNIRNKPVKRGIVAQALAYLADGQTDLYESINFLLNNEISTGQNPQYQYRDIEKYFGSSNNLTRAQVVAFLYRMDKIGFNRLSDYVDMPNGDSINNLAAIGQNYVHWTLSSSTVNGGYVPKEGLRLTYYPSILTDEKETFNVVKDKSCTKLVNTVSNGHDFCYIENSSSLRMGLYATDWVFFNLTYPMQQGREIKDKSYAGGYENVYVESTSEIVKVKAGTFYNVVVLHYPTGETLYVAKDVGLIKATDSNGEVSIELHSIRSK